MPPHKPATMDLVDTLSIASEHEYRYSLLPNAKTYIRLLKLTAEEEELVGSLEAFPVTEAPPFCALSYAWGTDPPASSFICDSAPLTVTEHLLSGMKQVRRCNPTPWIWIDAICINQTDNLEKADQLPLMEKIYSLAEQVLVWLGEATEDTEHALGQLEHIRDRIQESKGYTLLGDESSYLKAGLPAAESLFWKTLADFYCRPWFHRLWVVQECVLSKDVRFICGSQILDFELLRSLSFELYDVGICERLKALVVAGFRSMRGPITVINLGFLREGFLNSPLNLLSLLHGCSAHCVTEPVDRIYGLLGLITEITRKEITVDYSAEARSQYWRLYISVAKLLVRSEGLYLLTNAASEERPLQLPSWVPNWNSTASTKAVASHFHAGVHGKATTPSKDIFIAGSDSIQLHGFQIGTILSTSALEFKEYKNSEDFEGPNGVAAQILDTINETYANYRRLCHGPEDTLLRRFARTLVADTTSRPGIDIDDLQYLQDPHEDYLWFREYLLDCKYSRRGWDVAANRQRRIENASAYIKDLPAEWRNRSFFVTDSGRIGLCSRSCQPGDIVCIFLSAKHTYVLRKVPDKSSFTLVSCAYTDEVMYGETLDKRDPANDEIFVID